MEPIEYLRTLLRRWPIIAIGAFLGAAFAFVGTDANPQPQRNEFRATHTLLSTLQSFNADSQVGTITFAQVPVFAPTGGVPERAAEKLGWDGPPAALAAEVTVESDPTTGTIVFSTQQENFRSQTVVDQDRNGVGEFGLLGELTGQVVPRRIGASLPVSPRLIDAAFQVDANSLATRYGFHFQVHLPTDDAGGAGSDADLGGDATTPGTILANGNGITWQQYYWCAYAWPVAANTGDRAFFIDHSGALYQTRGDAVKYAGSVTVPAANAAYTGVVFTSKPGSGPNNVGNDGNRWTVVQ